MQISFRAIGFLSFGCKYFILHLNCQYIIIYINKIETNDRQRERHTSYSKLKNDLKFGMDISKNTEASIEELGFFDLTHLKVFFKEAATF